METNVNKVQVCELDEKALVNAFEVEELEKRYEMGWFTQNRIPNTQSLQKEVGRVAYGSFLHFKGQNQDFEK